MRLISGLGLGAAALIASTGLAMAGLDFNVDKKNVAGKHQIYVWCTSGQADTTVTVEAANADEAIKKAVAGKANCWGVWKGLVT